MTRNGRRRRIIFDVRESPTVQNSDSTALLIPLPNRAQPLFHSSYLFDGWGDQILPSIHPNVLSQWTSCMLLGVGMGSEYLRSLHPLLFHLLQFYQSHDFGAWNSVVWAPPNGMGDFYRMQRRGENLMLESCWQLVLIKYVHLLRFYDASEKVTDTWVGQIICSHE